MSLAIAQRYASALVEVLEKPAAETSLDSALQQLRSLGQMLDSSPELRNVFAAPTISNADKRGLIVKLGERISLSTPVRNLLFVMLDHRRMGMMADLLEVLQRISDERRGVEHVEVSSALPLPEDQKQAIADGFQRLRGKRIEADYRVDEALLGGIVVRAGSTLYDGSLVSQLRALDRAMAGDS